MSGGALYVVATPIGNLGDFSFRGVEVLRRAAVVACEDTRRTRRLLTHFEIRARVTSIHAHTRGSVIERLLDRVEAGEEVAYVSDAGTPAVSDPGATLAARAHERGLRVVAIPGPAAVVAALAASGLPGDRFVFLGFLPRRGGPRAAMLDRVAKEQLTTVCYEAPGRTADLLDDLAATCGAEREGVVARELTKVHEEVRRGTLRTLAAYYRDHPPRGEVTVVVAGEPDLGRQPVRDDDVRRIVEELKDTGAPAAVAKELARRLGISRQDAYRLLTG